MKFNGKAKLLASSVRMDGSRILTDDGEINASNTKDLLKVVAHLAERLQQTDIVTEEEASAMEAETLTAAEKRQIVATIIDDNKGEVHREVGREMAGTIRTQVDRQSIMRRVLNFAELEQGERPQINVETRGIMATVMDGPTQARMVIAEDFFVTPPEFNVGVRLYIDNVTLAQSREDLLQRKYNEGLQGILVAEDRAWKKLADAMISRSGLSSTHVGANGRVSPTVLEAGVTQITDQGLPLANIIIASGLWTGITLNTDYNHLIDPVTRLELLRTGIMGSIFGAQLITDHARHPDQKVLEKNEVYYTSLPEFIGEYTDRGGVTATPIGPAETAINGAGWHLNELMSMAMPNPLAVAKTVLA